MANEDYLKDIIVHWLSPYFDITYEVWSSDMTKRIDLVIYDKNEGNCVFGIECKKGIAKDEDYRNGRSYAQQFKQVLEYNKKLWKTRNGEMRIPIIIYPTWSIKSFVFVDEIKIIDGETYYKDRHYPDHHHHTINGYLGGFNIGEIRSYKGYGNKRDFRIMFNNKIIWDIKTMWDERIKDFGNNHIHYKNYAELMQRIESFDITKY